jgi:trans-aconitate methyltransferase
MERILEPTELMSDEAQAQAYAEADFSEPDANFIHQFGERFPDYDGDGLVLDIGCGPGNITWRFAERYPRATLHGVDGSAAMLKYGYGRLENMDPRVRARITLIEGFVPGVILPARGYDVILSNSLLHHLTDPQALWTMVRERARPGTRIFIGDLSRPASQDAARQLVETYAGTEPELLKTDFYNSLCAAFTLAEIQDQLRAAGLAQLQLQAISDRHLAIHGQMT